MPRGSVTASAVEFGANGVTGGSDVTAAGGDAGTTGGIDRGGKAPGKPDRVITSAGWPLVGRNEELQRLDELVRSNECRAVVVAGGWGVGKTRLGAECLRLADRSGLVTVQVTATRAAASLPLGTLASVLSGGEAGPSGAGPGSPPGDGPFADNSARTTPAESRGPGPAGEPGRPTLARNRRPGGLDGRSVWARATAALADRAQGRRLVMFIDDAHLLDDASATLVHQLAATGAATVLATVTTGEPVPDAVMALWKDGLAERIELDSLRRESVEELVSVALGGPVEPATVARLATRSQGNVLVLRELLLGARYDGVLVDGDAGWRLRGALSPPRRLVELIEARLEGLDQRERALLELVALAGTLGQAELTALSDAALVDGLERRSLLSSRLSGRRLEIGVAHPIYAEVLRDRLPAVRVRAMTRSLAETVEATGARRRQDALRVASWRLAGGGARPETMLVGAIAARRTYNYRLAERLARAAVDAGAGFEGALLAAELASRRGHARQAERELAVLTRRASDDTQRGLVALARINNSVALPTADQRRIVETADAGIGDTLWRRDLDARRLGHVLNHRGPQAAVAAAAPLLGPRDVGAQPEASLEALSPTGRGGRPSAPAPPTTFDGQASPSPLPRAERARLSQRNAPVAGGPRQTTGGRAFVFAAITGAYALARLGRLEAALDVAARGEAVQRDSPTPLTWYPWWHTVNTCLALGYAGRLEESDELATKHFERALTTRSKEAQSAFAIVSAAAVAERGRVRTAAQRAGEALALCRRAGRTSGIRASLIRRALAFALAGDAQKAKDALAEHDALGLPVMLGDEVDLLQARGWTAAAAGEIAEAYRWFEEAVRLGGDVGDMVGQAAALHGLARLGRAKQVREDLAAVAERIDGRLAPARAAHTGVLAEGNAAGLESVSREFEAMGADLLAAEAAADAAVARRRSGELRRATAAERRANLLAERCEGVATPALRAVEARAQLTAAERETALLATTGRSNRQIAEEQCLSVRTIENRLQRVYTKLGVTSRAALAQALDAER